ncbi:MAG: hypothetical protein JRI66_13480 [Deltaproteobacteria bacterium]|nr:hypothetical protein [Deltaproteobacteria bacterium]
MAVNIHRDLDTGVPHLLLHIHRAGPSAEQQTGIGMPDVVKADFPQACSLQDALEGIADGVLLHRSAVTVENELLHPARAGLQGFLLAS